MGHKGAQKVSQEGVLWGEGLRTGALWDEQESPGTREWQKSHVRD